MGHLKLLRMSLVVVWLATAVVSAIELRGQSAGLLQAAGMTDAAWINALIWAGVALDALLGLALWLMPRASVYWCALASMAVMTAVASLMLPSLWLHPLGPLLKNIPLAAMLWVLIQSTKNNEKEIS
jgi:DoxX-like family